MSTADASEAARAEQARAAARARWGSQVPDRAADIVIERVGELGEAKRSALHEVTAPPGGEPEGES
jgi:hypothetical protein